MPELEPPVPSTGRPSNVVLARVAPRVARVHAVAGERVVVARHAARDPVRELGELRLGDDDRAGVAQVLRERRVVRRHEVGERERAAGGRHVGRVDVVLERDRDPVQRSADASAGALAVERVGDRERVRVHRDDGVQPVLVERDAREVLQHDLARGRALLLERLRMSAMLASTTVKAGGRAVGPERVCAARGSGESDARHHGAGDMRRMGRIDFMRSGGRTWICTMKGAAAELCLHSARRPLPAYNSICGLRRLTLRFSGGAKRRPLQPVVRPALFVLRVPARRRQQASPRSAARRTSSWVKTAKTNGCASRKRAKSPKVRPRCNSRSSSTNICAFSGS